MKKNKWKKKMMAKMAVIFLLLGILSGTGRAAKVQAAETPLITKLQVAATEDGTQIMAQCDFQNYDDQSGCVMTLYLYRVGDENEMSIAAYKKIPYEGEGSAAAVAAPAGDGIYLASVGMDYGGRVVQINSEHYYRVAQSGDKVEISKIPEEGQEGAPENEFHEESNTCIHEWTDEIVRPATAERDALMAVQCMLCGEVLEYVELPNSAYAAFQFESMEAIQNAKANEVLISTRIWMSFHWMVLEAISQREDVTVILQYQYQGKAYEVTIPAGADVRSLADENGFCGFRYLNQVFDEKV